MSEKNIKQIYDEYAAEMAKLYFHKSTIHDLYKNELERLKNPNYKNSEDMVFEDFRDGQLKKFEMVETNLEEQQELIFILKNRQYQWLVAEAFEHFDDFIENAYAYIGYIDNSCWPMRDYGNIKLNELGNKKFDWFLTQSQSKKTKDILNEFRTLFPDLKSIESEPIKANKKKLHPKFVLNFIAQLRHRIVHNGGKVNDKTAFIKTIFAESGISNKSNKGQYDDFINYFLCGKENGKLDKSIILLEHHNNDEFTPLTFHPISRVFDCLMSYSVILCELIENYEDKNVPCTIY
ncbi:MAG: hypothetical protein PHQ03_09455 [Methylococcales bacterium]|nr:hypothetical protein [Methylococcales bacterium]